MFLPIRTDRKLKTTPWVNYALIAINVLIFGFTYQKLEEMNQVQGRLIAVERELIAIDQRLQSQPSLGEIFTLQPRAMALQVARARLIQQLESNPLRGYYLQPAEPHLYQFVSYQFLHASLMHLVGNMIFLFIFGNGVEDRLGKLGYVLFYLAGGVLAGLGHYLTSASPVLGASGAVAAVTGAYLALFPLSNVTIVYWFWIVGAFEVSSMVLILFRVGQDALFHVLGVGNVAYVAHLAGYAFGFTIGMALLVGRLLPREQYDMLALIEQRRRREGFRKLTRREGYQPWDHTRPGVPPTTAAPAPTAKETALMAKRAVIAEALAAHDLPTAARRYIELLETHPGQVMGQQQQLDIANQLMADGWYDHAANAYELFLTTYKLYPERRHIQLIVGLIHARYLDQPDRARTFLTEALPHLENDEKQLAESALNELDNRWPKP